MANNYRSEREKKKHYTMGLWRRSLFTPDRPSDLVEGYGAPHFPEYLPGIEFTSLDYLCVVKLLCLLILTIRSVELFFMAAAIYF